MALGGVFFYAGLQKRLEPYQFAEAILAYDLLPLSLVGLVAAILPWVELTSGFFLTLGYLLEIPGRLLVWLGFSWGNKLVGGLPYGTQKQIELARALAMEPELLLLDEPCAGMNAEEKQDMIFWIKDIQAELGVTILLIEHDMGMVMDISDRVLALNFGRSITQGTPAAVQRHPEVVRAYLGETGDAAPGAGARRREARA